MILTNAERQQEVAVKNARVLEFLRRENLSGLLITRDSNFAWATAGAEGNLTLFLRDDGRKFCIERTDNVSRMPVEGLLSLGYESRTVPWYPIDGQKEVADVLQELCGGRPFGTDVPFTGAKNVDREIALLRVPLTEGEVREFRWLGRVTAEAVEDVCRRIQPGMTDSGIEVLVSDALLSHAIRANALKVEADVRIPGEDGRPRSDVCKVENQAAISVCAERWGLKVGLTRLVHFGALTRESEEQLKAAVHVNAGFWARTLPGVSIGSILEGAITDYLECGLAKEWLRHNPGGAIGYEYPESPIAPGSTQTIRTPQAFAWRASVADLRVEDTILLVEDRMEVVTETSEWPRVESKALGKIYRSPGILRR